LTVSQAAAVVKSRGYTPSDPGGEWRADHTLKVLVAVKTGSGDGRIQKAFFFVGPRFIGTDTSDPSRAIRVAAQQDATVALTYALYKPSDPFCCPSGRATVRYHWTGSRLTPLDPIPPRSGSAPASR
jgi:hypothetical protein